MSDVAFAVTIEAATHPHDVTVDVQLVDVGMPSERWETLDVVERKVVEVQGFEWRVERVEGTYTYAQTGFADSEDAARIEALAYVEWCRAQTADAASAIPSRQVILLDGDGTVLLDEQTSAHGAEVAASFELEHQQQLADHVRDAHADALDAAQAEHDALIAEQLQAKAARDAQRATDAEPAAQEQ